MPKVTDTAVKKLIISVLFFILLYVYLCDGHAYPLVWERIDHDIRGEALVCMDTTSDGTHLFIGTDRAIWIHDTYKGKSKKIFAINSEDNEIYDIHIGENDSIQCATGEGIYISNDYGENWQRAYLGSFIESKGIRSVVSEKRARTLYIVRNNLIYASNDLNGIWLKLPKISVSQRYISDDEDDIGIGGLLINGITLDNDSRLYACTSRGVFRYDRDGEFWENISGNALGNNIHNCMMSDDKRMLYAATDAGVYIKDLAKAVWKTYNSGLTEVDILDCCMHSDGENLLWCLSKTNIYKGREIADDMKYGWYDLRCDPSIREVQEMAVRYAEVSPDKIKDWRRQAGYRALLPKVSFGLDNSESDTYEIYTSSSKSYYLNGPRDRSDGWDLTFTWDFADLVFNEHQTSIDVRSKLMVQLREDILNEVTRLYYERKRIIIETNVLPIEEDKKRIDSTLRIEELTAYIDALTGGEFSRAIHKKRINRGG